MTGLIKSEFRKLFSTQVWFWLLVASVALTALGVVVQIAGSHDEDLTIHVRDVFSSANASYLAVFVLGILAITTEFRYQTITPTVLATPSRWTIVQAKLIAYAVLGIGYALICVIVQLAVAVPWLAARGISYSLGDQVGALLAVFTVVALYSLVGLGVGAVLRNQIVAVSVGLISTLILENLFSAIPGVKHVYPYLPSGAVNAIVTAAHDDRTVNNVNLLPIWGGVVMLAVWGLGLAVLGAGLTMQRDIS
jgi:ABC-type transport system involved in multi-copper enzyme maturation permease subunit